MKFRLFVVFFVLCGVLCRGVHAEERSKEDLLSALATIDMRFGGVPEDFPEDIPVYDGLMGVSATDMFGHRSLSGTSEDDPALVLAVLKKAFLENGWTVGETTQIKDSSSTTVFEKEKRSIILLLTANIWDMTDVMIVETDEDRTPKIVFRDDEPEALEVMSKMADVYAQCDSYSDNGTVQTVFISRSGKRTSRGKFRTAFARPGKFRLEIVEDYDDRQILWHDGVKTIEFWNRDDGPEDVRTLELGLAGLGGAPTNVPEMLFEMDDSLVSKLKGLIMLDDGVDRGVACYRIEGQFWTGSPETLWIDKSSYLLRRIDEAGDFGDFTTEETILYSPRLNVNLTDKDFELNTKGQIPTPLWFKARKFATRKMHMDDPIVLCVTVAGACLVLAVALKLLKGKGKNHV